MGRTKIELDEQQATRAVSALDERADKYEERGLSQAAKQDRSMADAIDRQIKKQKGE